MNSRKFETTETQNNTNTKIVEKRIESTMKQEQKGVGTMYFMFAILYWILLSILFQ